MARTSLRRQLRRLVSALPRVRFLERLCRFYAHTVDGEGFADMTINGELAFLRSVAPDCRVVFDVGAHRGAWTARALEANGELEVHCFEPEPQAYEELAARPFPGRVLRRPLAVSSRTGRGELFLRTGSLYPKPRWAPGGPRALGPTATVELVTLDDYCREHAVARIDLLKLDVEGHEMAALGGASRLLAAGAIRRVQFEYGPFHIYARTFFKDFFELFSDHGYDVFKILPRSLERVAAYDERLDNFVYKNFAALRRNG